MGAISTRIIAWQVVYRSYRRGFLPRRHSRRRMTWNRRNRSHKKVSMFRRTRSVGTGRNAAAESLNRTRWDAMRLLPITMIGVRRPSVTDPACVLARRGTSRRRSGVEERRCRVLVGPPPHSPKGSPLGTEAVDRKPLASWQWLTDLILWSFCPQIKKRPKQCLDNSIIYTSIIANNHKQILTHKFSRVRRKLCLISKCKFLGRWENTRKIKITWDPSNRLFLRRRHFGK